MKKTLTYGTLPEREEFEAAFARETNWSYRFVFANDPRVGTCELTCNELWRELVKARALWAGDVEDTWEGRYSEEAQNAAGQWCSNVLGVLGFEVGGHRT